jgi:hypothetical protein
MTRKSTEPKLHHRDQKHNHFSVGLALCIWLLVSLTFLFTAQAQAASKWSTTVSNEDWGKTCFMTGKVGSNKSVGFYGSPGKHVVAFIDIGEVAFAENFISSWTIDDGPSLRLDGWLNEYFGFVDFKVPDLSILNEIASGSRLNIIATNIGNLTVTLSGSRSAYMKFAKCMNL